MTLMPLQAHSERVEKGSDRWIAQLLSFISSHRQQYICSMSRQLETAELELCDLRLKHESSLAAAREYEAKVDQFHRQNMCEIGSHMLLSR